jgi:hypothetical protein
MRTGSRPSTSSTRTSRTCPISRPPFWSSSKTVGIVRTGTPRSRHARTTRARIVPGADGTAISTSSGPTSSSTRGSSSVLPSTSSPRSIGAPCLRGSSSTKPTGR